MALLEAEALSKHFGGVRAIDQFSYHWPLYGLGLGDDVLKQVYHENAAKLLAAREA